MQSNVYSDILGAILEKKSLLYSRRIPKNHPFWQVEKLIKLSYLQKALLQRSQRLLNAKFAVRFSTQIVSQIRESFQRLDFELSKPDFS